MGLLGSGPSRAPLGEARRSGLVPPRAPAEGPLAPGLGERAGVSCALASPFFLALLPILVTAGLRRGSDPVALVTVRTAIAALCAWAIVAATSGLVAMRDGWIRDPVIVLAGFAGYGIGPLAGYFALQRLDPTAYISIYYLHVPLVAIALQFLGYELASRRAFLSALLCSVGVFLAVGAVGTTPEGVGDPVALALAGLAIAGTLVLAVALHQFGRNLDPTRLNAEFMTTATLVFVVVLIARRTDGVFGRDTLLIGAAIAILAWFPGRLSWTFAVRSVGARTAGIFGSLQPGLVALFGFAFLHQQMSAYRWLGIVVLSVGVSGLYLRRPVRLLTDV